jgi:hypothetical protein
MRYTSRAHERALTLHRLGNIIRSLNASDRGSLGEKRILLHDEDGTLALRARRLRLLLDAVKPR